MLLCADAAAASADLADGLLVCPSCRTGQLKPWGHGRERVIRLLNGASARLRPQRARCGSCGRTHIVLPSWCAPRRADAVQVIGAAAALALAGAGSARIGAVLGVPAAAVRGWLRRLRSRAEDMRQDAMHQLGFIAGLAGLATRRCPRCPGHRWVMRSTRSPHASTPRSPGSACRARTCGRCWAGSAWPATSPPPAPADHCLPARAPACPRPARDAHYDRHGVIRAAHRDTVSTTETP